MGIFNVYEVGIRERRFREIAPLQPIWEGGFLRPCLESLNLD